MAIIYGKNTAVDYAAGNLASFGKSYSRMGAAPLDMYEVWYDLAELQKYASFRGNDANGNPVYDGETEVVDTSAVTSYVGQKVAYVDDTNGKIYHYSIELDGSLKEIGVAPLGDGKSVSVSAEGVVSLLGVDTADSLTLPRMKEDKSGIEWVPVSAVVQGDGNDNTTYTFTPITKGEGEAAETYGFIVKTLFNGTEVEGGEFTFSFDVYTKSEVDAAIKEVADLVGVPAEDDDSTDTLYERVAAEILRATNAESALSDRIGLAKDGETAATGVYAYVDGVVNALVNGVDPDKIDSLNELIAWVEAHPDIVSGLDERLIAAENKLAGIGGEEEPATVIEAIGDAISAHEGVADEKYATKQEIADAGYAVAADVEREYAKKATTLEGYGITDAYTKNEVDAKIGTPGVPAVKDSEGNVTTEAVAGTGVFANTYSKAELNALLDEIEGGSTESAASVARQLDEYKTSNNERVKGIEDKVGKDVNGEESATGLFLEVDEARKVADEAKSASTKNTGDIAALIEQLANTNINVSNNATEIGKINTEITTGLKPRLEALEGADEVIEGTLAEHTAAIKAINETTIPALQGAVNSKAAQTDVDAINQKIGTVTEGKTVVDMINEVAGTIDFSPYAKTEDVAKTYATIEALNEEVARADAAEKVNAKAIADLAAGAVKKNTDDIATINALLNTVDSEDTITSLKELAIWVEEHDTEVIPVINEHTEAIEALEGKMTTVETAVNTTLPGVIAQVLVDAKAYTDEKMVKADGTSIVNNEGTFSVGVVSTDNLVQGTMTLVLNGGDAKVTA